MWSQLEVDLEGMLNWSVFIAGLRLILIKQHSVAVHEKFHKFDKLE